MKRKFKTGQDLADYIKQQLNVDIYVDTTFKEKPRKGIVYMEIPNHLPTHSLLAKLGVRIEGHLKNRYFVYLV